MRGIVLAGGTGSRLAPLTSAFSKQLLPVYDKPMVMYPIATLMAAGIREIALVTTESDSPLFQKILGDGSRYGISLQYVVQQTPKGIPDAFNVCRDFIEGQSVALILGDNVFHGSGLGRDLAKYTNIKGAQVFAYKVSNPSEYGVIEFDSTGEVISIEEKPEQPHSNYAIPGLYFFDNSVTQYVLQLNPSRRGELEIADLLKMYLASKELQVTILPRGTAWLDTGTPEGLIDAGNFVRVIESRQGIKIACLEEVAWRMGWISKEDLEKNAKFFKNSYGEYLQSLSDD
jgi:glucose-1-phosphate thymidylyltransferase